jgi:predicted AAA+ superfamily ATPase
LSAYAEDSAFKLFAIDVGLLGALAKISEKTLIHEEGIFTEFKGAFVENYVEQTLHAAGTAPFYWHSEGKAEVDFLVEHDGIIFPVEAKAGTNVRSRSLAVFIEKFNPPFSVRMSLKNFERNGRYINIPLYAAENVPEILSALSL